MLKNSLIISSLLMIFSVHNAYGYIEPGTAGIVIQALIGTLVGVGIALKLYWYKLKEKFSKK
jgi:hypothetical protein|tara:strand:+ start:306 stop:491 length:186 start_codon:yes stop_codon:yes gene_type:complete